MHSHHRQEFSENFLDSGWLHIHHQHIISYHIISYHIISYHIISYHIISYHIISYHIIPYHCHMISNVGGFGGKNNYSIYNPRDNSWKFGPKMPKALMCHGMAYNNGRLYVFGGVDIEDQNRVCFSFLFFSFSLIQLVFLLTAFLDSFVFNLLICSSHKLKCMCSISHPTLTSYFPLPTSLSCIPFTDSFSSLFFSHKLKYMCSISHPTLTSYLPLPT